MKIRTKEHFPYKVGEFATYPEFSYENAKIVAVSDNWGDTDFSVIMAEMPDDGYVVAKWDKSEKALFDVEFHETDEIAIFDYIERAFGVSV